MIFKFIYLSINIPPQMPEASEGIVKNYSATAAENSTAGAKGRSVA